MPRCRWAVVPQLRKRVVGVHAGGPDVTQGGEHQRREDRRVATTVLRSAAGVAVWKRDPAVVTPPTGANGSQWARPFPGYASREGPLWRRVLVIRLTGCR